MTTTGDVSSEPEAAVPKAAGRPRWLLIVVGLVVIAIGAILVARSSTSDDQSATTVSQRSVGDLLAEAVALHSSGLTDNAIDRYEEILAIDPENALALYNLGQIAQQRGEATQAIALYDRALAADPNLGSAAFNRAIALRDLGEQAAAIDAFEVLLEQDPDSPGVLFNLGQLYIAAGDPERGVALVNRSTELNPALRGD